MKTLGQSMKCKRHTLSKTICHRGEERLESLRNRKWEFWGVPPVHLAYLAKACKAVAPWDYLSWISTIKACAPREEKRYGLQEAVSEQSCLLRISETLWGFQNLSGGWNLRIPDFEKPFLLPPLPASCYHFHYGLGTSKLPSLSLQVKY